MATLSFEPIMLPALYAQMNDPSFLWGDYLVDDVAPVYTNTSAAAASAVVAALPEVVEVIAAAPALVMRKDIWERFPVHVEYINTDVNGFECWSVAWHRKRCATEICDVETLMEALYTSPSWVVHEARHSNEICVLQMMNRSRRSPAASPKASPKAEDGWTQVVSAAKPVQRTIYLERVNDIVREFSAVSWNNLTRPGMSARRGDVLAIIGNGKMRDQANPAGYVQRLLAALHESTSWRVLRPEGREICCLEMA